MIICTEHSRLLHAGPTLLSSSISSQFHIIGNRRVVCNITSEYTICKRNSAKLKPPIMGKLPMERVTPGPVFDKVGVDYAGPIYVKYGYVRKPTIVKAYISVFVALYVKASWYPTWQQKHLLLALDDSWHATENPRWCGVVTMVPIL